jgi:hypothetical protein
MIASMIHGDPDPEDLRKYFRALRRAQSDLDLRPDRYTHYYKNEFPREETFAWIAHHGIFAETRLSHRGYKDSVMSLEATE